MLFNLFNKKQQGEDPEMKLYIGAYYGVSIISRCIQIVTWGPKSHIALIKKSGETIEAWHNPNGVKQSKTPWSLHTPNTVVALFELNYDGAEVWRRAEAEVGKPYDFRALLGFIPVLRLFHKNDPTKWFCSELAAYACDINEAKGKSLFNHTVEYHKIDPSYLTSSPNLSFVGNVMNMEEFKKVVNE